MSRRGPGKTNITGRPRHKLFKQIVPEQRAAQALSRFKRAEIKAQRGREVLAVRQILLIVYPTTSYTRVCAANGWGDDLYGAGKLAGQILDDLYQQSLRAQIG